MNRKNSVLIKILPVGNAKQNMRKDYHIGDCRLVFLHYERKFAFNKLRYVMGKKGLIA